MRCRRRFRLVRCVWRDEIGEAGQRFAFRHTLVRRALYEAIPAPERRRRHLEIARTLEARAATTHLPVSVSDLADHFYEAMPETDLEKTVRYCDEAAKFAYRSYALADVARHMKQALAALALMPVPPLEPRMDLLFRLALYTRGPEPDTFRYAVREVIRLARLGFEVRAELQLGEGDALSAQLSRAEADLLELAEGQIVHVRIEPVVSPAA